MKIYLIIGYDANYGTNSGMYDWDIRECRTRKEAENIGIEMAAGVIESYSSLMDEIENDVRERMQAEGITSNDPDYDDIYDDWLDDAINEVCEYQVYELRADFDYSKLPDDMDWEEIRDIYSIDFT